jgi:hypothetical protein
MLVYLGAGRFLPGIPANDLSAAQLAALARDRGTTVNALRTWLIASGLYQPAKR